MELGTSWYFIRHGYATYDNVKSNIKQQEIKDQVAATKWLWEVASKLQIQRKKVSIFHLILVGIPSILILSVTNRVDEGVIA